MKIPEIFFGKKTEIRKNLNIIVNRLLKNNLEEQFREINCIDTNLLNDFLINYDVSFHYMKSNNCFYLSELTKLIFFSDRFSGEDINIIRDENITVCQPWPCSASPYTGWQTVVYNRER